MAERDAIAEPRDVAAALALLTRLPVPLRTAPRGAEAAWAYPLAGLAVGLAAALAGTAATALGLPPAVAAGLMLAVSAAVTGAMHEDGLADCCDGFWGGRDAAERLRIMQDSRIGSYGVIALILSLGLRWAALAALIGAGHTAAPVIAAAALSRAPMAALMHALPAVRAGGLSHRVGRPARATAALGAALALVLGLFAAGPAALAAALAAAAAALATAAVARVKLGGQTGDVLGASQQLAEIAALASFAALLA